MLKYIIIAAVAFTSVAQAKPVTKEIKDAVQREQRIKDLSAPPASVFNICRGC